jgi:hypothetical protein
MNVKVKWHHVFAVSREIEIDEVAFTEWADSRYGEGYDRDLAIAAWIEYLDLEVTADVFQDWRTNKPLPSDFDLQYSEVIDAEPETADV